jgi:hypothetical protein
MRVKDAKSQVFNTSSDIDTIPKELKKNSFKRATIFAVNKKLRNNLRGIVSSYF